MPLCDSSWADEKPPGQRPGGLIVLATRIFDESSHAALAVRHQSEPAKRPGVRPRAFPDRRRYSLAFLQHLVRCPFLIRPGWQEQPTPLIVPMPPSRLRRSIRRTGRSQSLGLPTPPTALSPGSRRRHWNQPIGMCRWLALQTRPTASCPESRRPHSTRPTGMSRSLARPTRPTGSCPANRRQRLTPQTGRYRWLALRIPPTAWSPGTRLPHWSRPTGRCY